MSSATRKIQVQQVQVDPSAVVAKALVRAAEALGLSQQELAQTVGSSPSSMSRTFAGARPVVLDSAEGRHALLFLRIFRSLDALVGGDAGKARAWLGAANTHLGGHVPRERLKSTEGLVHVADYLDAMRGTL